MVSCGGVTAAGSKEHRVAQSSKQKTSPPSDVPPWEQPAEGGPVPLVEEGAPITGELIESTGEMIPFGPASTTVIQWCADNVSEDDESQAAAMEAIMARVLSSTTPDQVLSEELSVPVDRVLNRPIQIQGVRIGQTDFADGLPYYAILDCVYGNPPEPHVVTVGAFKVMAQLYALARLNQWPQVVMFKKAEKPTKSGFYPISMVRPPV
jgi:hypothetical protein